MSAADLRTIAITDFRSIRGTVAIPLNAPVVLLHGTNGAGKSTVMSALELALTGTVSGVDVPGNEFLVHRGAPKAKLQLSTFNANVEFTIQGTTRSGDPLLGADDRRFFDERCYLQQRTLGRLLELYETPTDGGESALTAFVNELLGLHELDALIDGLYPVTHKRRLKRLLPEYSEVEDDLGRRRRKVDALQRDLRVHASEAAEAQARFRELLAALKAPPALESDPDGTKLWLEQTGEAEERALVGLVGARRELAALIKRVEDLARHSTTNQVSKLESAAAAASSAADAWRMSHGAALETVLDELRTVLPGTPAATGAGDPAAVRSDALELVQKDVDRVTAALAADQLAHTQAESLDQAIAAGQHRLAALDQQIAASATATEAEALGKTLAALLPHLHTDDCPVCSRDYSEISKEPLSAHLAARVSGLSAQAQRLQELAQARLQAASDLRRLEDERLGTGHARLEPGAKLETQAMLAWLEGVKRRLVELAPGVAQGASLIRGETETARDLAIARDRDRASAELRSAVDAIAASVGRLAPASATPLTDAVAALAQAVDEDVAVLEDRAGQHTAMTAAIDELRRVLQTGHQLESDAAVETDAIARAHAAIKELERRRSIMRTLRSEAEAARVRVVRRVFTDSLNRVWRNLFVRLAPEEPFVPAFSVPDASPRVVAKLETIHRDGRPGGPPAAMLSAGNLNTAALTLFLALNLSVENRLPWILLDDPVQSMDEVHIAQFAALLRTLAREHGRRLFIAVHERALFEYLTLELSPAAPEESLITVELARAQDGSTIVQADFQSYVEDRAFVPA